MSARNQVGENPRRAVTDAFEGVEGASVSPLPLSWERSADRGRKVRITQAGGSPPAWGLGIVGRARESTTLQKSSGDMWPVKIP